MKRALVAAAVGLVVGCAPASAAWSPGESFVIAQAQKGHAGPPPPRAERPSSPQREVRQERPEQRRDRMSEDQRQSLHRDLDKANREIYGRPPQK